MKTISTKTKIFILVFSIPLILIPLIIFADSTSTNCYTFETGVPFFAAKGECKSPSGFQNMISSLIKILFPLAGVLAFAMIVWAGFEYATSGGDTNKQKDAQDRITNAIIGLILLFAFWIIIYTINPDILKIQNLNLNANTNTSTPTPDNTGVLAQIGNWYLRQELVDILQRAPATRAGHNISYKITDACLDNKVPCQIDAKYRCDIYGLTESHCNNSCHNQGYCVDIVPINKNAYPSFILSLCQVLKVLYENIGTTNAHLHISLPAADNIGFASYYNQNKTCYYYRDGAKRILFVPGDCGGMNAAGELEQLRTSNCCYSERSACSP